MATVHGIGAARHRRRRLAMLGVLVLSILWAQGIMYLVRGADWWVDIRGRRRET